ncbi:tRNA pseudouridine synthase 1 [Coelomomyces lativittatus]|nr:tRNA pseudouridine synthase 1 [Coelomomyces lativittatus]KAJ1516974.1 tRNA pseudouridine synthase 1 [Coelomomyces lativittatus]
MLHQIRKMIGLIIWCMKRKGVHRSDFPSHVFDITSSPLHVPKAPGIGLFLNQCMYSHYNEQGQKKACFSSLELEPRLPLEFHPYQALQQEFFMNVIQKKIVEEEMATQTFQGWIDSILRAPGHPLSFLTPPSAKTTPDTVATGANMPSDFPMDASMGSRHALSSTSVVKDPAKVESIEE